MQQAARAEEQSRPGTQDGVAKPGPPQQAPAGDGQGPVRKTPRLRALVQSRAFQNILVDEVDMMQSRAATLIQTSWRRHRLRQKLTSQVLAARSVQEAWRRLSRKRLLRKAAAVGVAGPGHDEHDIPYHKPQQVRFRAPGDPIPEEPIPVPAAPPTAQPPAQLTVQLPMQPTTQPTTHPMAQLTTQLTAQPTAQLPTQRTAQTTAQTTAQLPTQQPTQPMAQLPTQSTAQLPTQPTAQLPRQPTTQLPTHPTAQLPTHPTACPVAPLMLHKETQYPSVDSLPPVRHCPDVVARSGGLLSRLVRGTPGAADGDASRGPRPASAKGTRAPAGQPRAPEGPRAPQQAPQPRTCPPNPAARMPAAQPGPRTTSPKMLGAPRAALPTCLTALLSRPPPVSPTDKPPAASASRTPLHACLASLLNRGPAARTPAPGAASSSSSSASGAQRPPRSTRPTAGHAPAAPRPARPSITVTKASLQQTCRSVTLAATHAGSPAPRLGPALGRSPTQLRSVATVLRTLCAPAANETLRPPATGPGRPRNRSQARTLHCPPRPKSCAPGGPARPPPTAITVTSAERPRTCGQKPPKTAGASSTSVTAPRSVPQPTPSDGASAGVRAPTCTHTPHPLAGLNQLLESRPVTPRSPDGRATPHRPTPCRSSRTLTPSPSVRPLPALPPPAVRPACSVDSWGDTAAPPMSPGSPEDLDLRSLLARALPPVLLGRPRSWLEVGRAVQGRLLDALCRALSADERAALGRALCQGELGAVLGSSGTLSLAAPSTLALLTSPLDLQLCRGGAPAAWEAALGTVKVPLAQVSLRAVGGGGRGDGALLPGVPCWSAPPNLGLSIPGGLPGSPHAVSTHVVSFFWGTGEHGAWWDSNPLPAPPPPAVRSPPAAPFQPLAADGAGSSAPPAPGPPRPSHRPRASSRGVSSPWAGRGGAVTSYPYAAMPSGGVACVCQGPWVGRAAPGRGSRPPAAPKAPVPATLLPETPRQRRTPGSRRAHREQRKAPPVPAPRASTTGQASPVPPRPAPPAPCWTLNTLVEPSLVKPPPGPPGAERRRSHRPTRERRRGRGAARAGPEPVGGGGGSPASSDGGPERSESRSSVLSASSLSLSTASDEAWAARLGGSLPLEALLAAGSLGGARPHAPPAASPAPELVPVLAQGSVSNLFALSVRWGSQEQQDLGSDLWAMGWTRGGPGAPCKAGAQRSLSLGSLLPTEAPRPPRPPGPPGLWPPALRAPFDLPFRPLKLTPSFSEPAMFSLGPPSSSQLSAASGGVPSLSPSQTWVAGGGVPILGQPAMNFAMPPCLPPPPMTFGVTPSLTQLPLAFEVTPSLASSSVTSGVTPIQGPSSTASMGMPRLAQPPMNFGVTPIQGPSSTASMGAHGLAQSPMNFGVAPIQVPPATASRGTPGLAQPVNAFGVTPTHTQSSKTSEVSPRAPHPHLLGAVGPNLAQSSVTFEVTPTQVPPSKTHVVNPTQTQSLNASVPTPVQAPLTKTNMADPDHKRPSVTFEVTPIQTQLSKININSTQTQPSKTNIATPTQGPLSSTNLEAPDQKRPFVTFDVIPLQTQSSSTNMVAPSQTQSSKANLVDSIQTQSSKANMVDSIQTQSSKANMVTPAQAPTCKTSMPVSFPERPSVTFEVLPPQSQLSKTNLVAPIQAPSPETNLVIPTQTQPPKTNMIPPEQKRPSVTFEVTPLQDPSPKTNMAAPSKAPSVPTPAPSAKASTGSPGLAQSMVTFGVIATQTPSLPVNTVTPGLAQSVATYGVSTMQTSMGMPHLSQPSLTSGGLFPGLTHSPLPHRVTPSPTQMPLSNVGTLELTSPVVSSQLASSLFQPLALEPLSTGVPGEDSRVSCHHLGPRPRLPPEPLATPSHPTFTVDVCYSRPCLLAIRSVAQELSQASVGGPTQAVPRETGVPPNPQAPQFRQLPLGFPPSSGACGRPPGQECVCPDSLSPPKLHRAPHSAWQQAQKPPDLPEPPSPPPCEDNTWASVPRGLSLSTSRLSLAGSSPGRETPSSLQPSRTPGTLPPVLQAVSRRLSSEAVLRVITGVARGPPPPYPEKKPSKGCRAQPPTSGGARPPHPGDLLPAAVPSMVADLLAGALSQGGPQGSLLVGLTPRPFPGTPTVVETAPCQASLTPRPPKSPVPRAQRQEPGEQGRAKAGALKEQPTRACRLPREPGQPSGLAATPGRFPSHQDGGSAPLQTLDWSLSSSQDPRPLELLSRAVLGSPNSAHPKHCHPCPADPTPGQRALPTSGSELGSSRCPLAPPSTKSQKQNLVLSLSPRGPMSPSALRQGLPGTPQNPPESPRGPQDFSRPSRASTPGPRGRPPLRPEAPSAAQGPPPSKLGVPRTSQGPPPSKLGIPRACQVPPPSKLGIPRDSQGPSGSPQSQFHNLGRRKSFRFLHGASDPCDLSPQNAPHPSRPLRSPAVPRRPESMLQAPRQPLLPRKAPPGRAHILIPAISQDPPESPEPPEPVELLQQAAVTIQAGARGFLVRRTVRGWHQWALVIQAAWRGHRVRLALWRQVRAAVTIQAVWRGFSARRQGPGLPPTASLDAAEPWTPPLAASPAPGPHRCFQACPPHPCALCSALGPSPSVVMLVGASPRTCHTCGQTLPTRVVQGHGRAGAPDAPAAAPASPTLCPGAAATTIQAAWRGFRVRRRLQEEQGAARRLQANWRGARTRMALTPDALLRGPPWDSHSHSQWPGV